ncbi:MAG: hypothetical protein A3I14_09050 [Candidatus Rokubacteria bacterium RIFCSPLOWO2_02_FULL_73_56]|nr:MAG: hypothetical protein A3I14_09050 [Candidatus Rokubacteria bacterium RIFCSPLOWO2_02_FULL_73_56]OGL25007.1 MAG: hypothetical protein A3G44_00250 [Candidatus Rokubacteria bacterium RIFCSPLOWO2_12_FULL_73_47]
MAKRTPRPKKPGKSRVGEPPKVYEHKEEKLLLRPDVGLQPQFKAKKPPKTYRYDPSLDPARSEVLLLSEGFEADSHAGVIALLHREFVRTGKLDRAQAAALERAWKERGQAEYEAGAEFTQARAGQAVERAGRFLRAVEALARA